MKKLPTLVGSVLGVCLSWSVFFSPSVSAHGSKTNGPLRPAHPVPMPSWFLELLVGNAMATARIRVSEQDGYRYIEADGLPDHETGQFPNRNNPNTISQQDHGFRVPLHPQKASQISAMNRQSFGVALNGVPFDPNTAEFWNNDRSSGWNIDANSGFMDLGLDDSNAHVQPGGAYHYHGVPTGLLDKFPYRDKPIMLGYAADGFPIYGPYGFRNAADPNSALVLLKPSYQLKSGQRPSGPKGAYSGLYVQDFDYAPGRGDLDQCNGRTAATPENPAGQYHYVLTTTFPFVPRCFTGTPDSSFTHQPPANAGGRPNHGSGDARGHGRDRLPEQDGPTRRRGPPDLREAAKKLGVSFDKLRRALGPPPPNFERAATQLGISVEDLKKVLPRPRR